MNLMLLDMADGEGGIDALIWCLFEGASARLSVSPLHRICRLTPIE